MEQINAIRDLTALIPLNDFGLPTGIYRVDLLPFHHYVPKGSAPPELPALELDDDLELGLVPDEDTDDKDSLGLALQEQEQDTYRIAGFPTDELGQAFIPLQFDEGFPAFDNGQPFWARFDFEPGDAFMAFQHYIQMDKGKTATDPDDDFDGQAAGGTRTLSDLAAALFPDNQVLDMLAKFQQYYHLYYWGLRAHAYDLFRVAQFRKQQELRAVETQGDHYVIAQRLRHRLMQYFDSEDDFWDLMTPKVGIDMFKMITSLERISAGVPASGPMSEVDQKRQGTAFEVHLRSIAQTHRISDGATTTEDGELLDRALENPLVTEVLQELIIRAPAT